MLQFLHQLLSELEVLVLDIVARFRVKFLKRLCQDRLALQDCGTVLC
jgi:hypothetical protein